MQDNNYERMKKYIDEIEKVKNELAISEGRKKELLLRLKEEFHINTIEKAKSTLDSLRKKIQVLEKEFEEKMSYIEATYEL